MTTFSSIFKLLGWSNWVNGYHLDNNDYSRDLHDNFIDYNVQDYHIGDNSTDKISNNYSPGYYFHDNFPDYDFVDDCEEKYPLPPAGGS